MDLDILSVLHKRHITRDIEFFFSKIFETLGQEKAALLTDSRNISLDCRRIFLLLKYWKTIFTRRFATLRSDNQKYTTTLGPALWCQQMQLVIPVFNKMILIFMKFTATPDLIQ